MQINFLDSVSLREEIPTSLKCYVFLSIDQEAIDNFIRNSKARPFGLVLSLDNSFPGEEGQQATLLDIETFFNVLSCTKPEHELLLVEDRTEKILSFCFCVAAYLHQKDSIEEAMYKTVRRLPKTPPDALWTIMCMDKYLDLQGRLVAAYDDYLVTKLVINKQGNIAEGAFNEKEY
jgi:hypothetical protein